MDDRENPKRVVARSYDLIAERHAEWAAGVRQEERARFAAILVNAIPLGSALLELGCGTAGRTTHILARRFRLTGIDISPRSIELARAVIPDATLLAADMTTVVFSAGSFDAVAAFYSIIHIPRDELGSLFRRIFTWLRPGGLFVGSMNGSDDPGSFEDDWLGAPMFWSGHDPGTTRRLVEAAGFTVESLTLETADEDGEPVSFWWLVARRPLPPGPYAVSQSDPHSVEGQTMDATLHDAPLAVLARLSTAMNGRDLAAFVACFAPDYASEQPAHPDRRFRGAEQVERNWAAMFAALPDFRVDVMRTASAADSVWVEWRWTGTRADGSRLNACGACIFGVRDGRIAWGRLYMEEIEAGRGIEAAVAELSVGKASGEAVGERPAAPATVDAVTPRPDAT